MAKSELKIAVFDPALPTETIEVGTYGFASTRGPTLISRAIRDRLPLVKDSGFEVLQLWVGVDASVRVPTVQIGIIIGTIKIEQITAIVVETAMNDIEIGQNALEAAFSIGTSDNRNQTYDSKNVRVSVVSAEKEDPSSLSIELYPLKVPFDIRNLEQFLRYQRRLYNIILIADRNLSFANPAALSEAALPIP